MRIGLKLHFPFLTTPTTLLFFHDSPDVSMTVSVIVEAPFCVSVYGSTTGSYHPPSPYSVSSTHHTTSPARRAYPYDHVQSASVLGIGKQPSTWGLKDELEKEIEEKGE